MAADAPTPEPRHELALPLRDAVRAGLPIHQRIVLERHLAGLSGSHCARAMSWSHTLWQELEAGQRPPRREELPRIAKILGISVHRLTGDLARATPGWKPIGRPRTRKATPAA